MEKQLESISFSDMTSSFAARSLKKQCAVRTCMTTAVEEGLIKVIKEVTSPCLRGARRNATTNPTSDYWPSGISLCFSSRNLILLVQSLGCCPRCDETTDSCPLYGASTPASLSDTRTVRKKKCSD